MITLSLSKQIPLFYKTQTKIVKNFSLLTLLFVFYIRVVHHFLFTLQIYSLWVSFLSKNVHTISLLSSSEWKLVSWLPVECITNKLPHDTTKVCPYEISFFWSRLNQPYVAGVENRRISCGKFRNPYGRNDVVANSFYTNWKAHRRVCPTLLMPEDYNICTEFGSSLVGGAAFF